MYTMRGKYNAHDNCEGRDHLEDIDVDGMVKICSEDVDWIQLFRDRFQW
jgi:hypothetical protein